MQDGERKQSHSRTAEEDAEALLDVVRRLAKDLHPHRKRAVQVTLDSVLDRDLGFDSLSRVELLLSIDREFGIRLPEQVQTSAETPRDLLRAVLSAGAAERHPAPRPIKVVSQEGEEGAPEGAETLLEVLEWHVLAQPSRPHVYLYSESEQPEAITYQELHDGARALAAGLRERALQPGQTVAIMLPTGRDYLYSFFGILLAGGIPVPIYPPVRPSQIEDHLRRHAGILANAQAILLITVPEAQAVARLLKAQVESLQSIVTPGELAAAGEPFQQPGVRAGDTAFLQYTSGSTGQPKGVILTHADLLANIRIMGEAVQADSTDVFVSWLPLYHDMGLIGAWLGSLYYGMPLVLMSPLRFLTGPQRWLWAIHHHHGTLSAAPNFAYELCLRKLQDSDLEGLDLGSWRLAFNGAEPVSPHTVRRFCERFARYGFRPQAMAPVYGLAETAVGLAFPPFGRGSLIDRIQREPLSRSGKALPADPADPHALEFVACGQPLPGYQIRIVDPAGRELPDRREGRLEFQGPSATSGYYRNPDATRTLFHGDWLDSGDLAYIAAGDVYVTSRAKDVIIRGGRNLYPYELEEAVGDIPGIRKGCVAVFGALDPGSGTERVVVVAETREQETALREELLEHIHAVSVDLLGLPADDVVLAPPHTVVKTSGGKIRRATVRESYETGRIRHGQRAVWWQLARVALASLRPRLHSAWRRFANTGYAGYAQFVFWVLAPPVWLLAVLLPHAHARWATMRAGARLLFRLTRTPFYVEGLEQLPRDRACVIVANHASYLDGVTLVAALPIEFGFVAKAELQQKFISHWFLRRIGAEFVQRFDKQRGVADARRTALVVRTGRSVVFFPEGTFTRMPGLLSFHMGAFVSAAENAVPVVPVTIRGTRSILRSGSWFPHRGAVHISVGAPIMPEGSDWDAAVKLRNAARATLLHELGEPDLARESPRL